MLSCHGFFIVQQEQKSLLSKEVGGEWDVLFDEKGVPPCLLSILSITFIYNSLR